MSMERESRRRSPSIIARLMGMEELPPQHLANKQQRGLLESCKKKTESTGPLKSKEEQEFKDVFEVVETKKSSANSTVNEDNIALFRQKVTDAKRFSTDEMFQSSKEFSETLDVLKANKDQNSLYAKHLSEIKRQHRESHCRHIEAKSTSEVQKCGFNDIGFGSDRDVTSKTDPTSYKKYNGNSLLCPHHGGANKARKSSPLRSENKDVKTTIPMRIVVLKPNLELSQSVSKSFSSPHSLDTFPSNGSVLTELPNDVGRNAKLRRKKNVSIDDEISIQKSEESREIAKQVTRRMKISLNTSSLSLSRAGFIGYAGDESSCYESGNDSATESDVTTLASRQSFHKNERQKTSLSHSSDVSSLNREAKKRLSERWEMSRRFEEVGSVGRSSTLGEVLALSDRKEKAEMLDIIFDQTGSSNRYVGMKGSAERAFPVGISSKEGWKDVRIKNILKSRSLPASSLSLEGPKAGMQCGTHRADRYLMPKEAINLGRNKAVMNNSNRKEGSLTCNSRSSARKSKRYLGTDSEDRDRPQEIHFSKNRLKISDEEDDASEEKKPISDASICNITDKSLVVDEVVVEHENLALFSEFPGDMVTEISDSKSVRNDSPPRVLDSSFAKETCGPSEEGSASFCHAVHEPESPAHSNSKEADVEPEQPSPASVLEASFLDDLSVGSECFGSLSAELQGLRMQLQLLKFESEEYAEGMIAISSDDDCEEDSTEKVDNQRETFSVEKSYESSYIDVVLIDSGFDNADPDTFMACPIDHSVFLKFEKKYCDQTKWLRPERRLLFDRINMGIREILKQSTKPYPWIKPSERRVSPERTKDVLHQLLESQEKKARNENTAEKVMEREVRWMDLEGDIDVIGGDIEKVLIDELVVEFITV